MTTRYWAVGTHSGSTLGPTVQHALQLQVILFIEVRDMLAFHAICHEGLWLFFLAKCKTFNIVSVGRYLPLTLLL